MAEEEEVVLQQEGAPHLAEEGRPQPQQEDPKGLLELQEVEVMVAVMAGEW